MTELDINGANQDGGDLGTSLLLLILLPCELRRTSFRWLYPVSRESRIQDSSASTRERQA